MGAFEYVAVDATGRERKGVIEGDTPRHVRQLLRDQGLLPVAVDEVVERKDTGRGKGPAFPCTSSAASAPPTWRWSPASSPRW